MGTLGVLLLGWVISVDLSVLPQALQKLKISIFGTHNRTRALFIKSLLIYKPPQPQATSVNTGKGLTFHLDILRGKGSSTLFTPWGEGEWRRRRKKSTQRKMLTSKKKPIEHKTSEAVKMCVLWNKKSTSAIIGGKSEKKGWKYPIENARWGVKCVRNEKIPIGKGTRATPQSCKTFFLPRVWSGFA